MLLDYTLVVDAGLEPGTLHFNHKTFGKLAVGVKRRCQYSHGFIGFNALQAYSPGTITENHRDISAVCGNIQPATVNFGAHQQNSVGQTAANIGIGSGHAIQKSGALLPDIQCRY